MPYFLFIIFKTKVFVYSFLYIFSYINFLHFLHVSLPIRQNMSGDIPYNRCIDDEASGETGPEVCRYTANTGFLYIC